MNNPTVLAIDVVKNAVRERFGGVITKDNGIVSGPWRQQQQYNSGNGHGDEAAAGFVSIQRDDRNTSFPNDDTNADSECQGDNVVPPSSSSSSSSSAVLVDTPTSSDDILSSNNNDTHNENDLCGPPVTVVNVTTTTPSTSSNDKQEAPLQVTNNNSNEVHNTTDDNDSESFVSLQNPKDDVSLDYDNELSEASSSSETSSEVVLLEGTETVSHSPKDANESSSLESNSSSEWDVVEDDFQWASLSIVADSAGVHVLYVIGEVMERESSGRTSNWEWFMIVRVNVGRMNDSYSFSR